MTSFPSSIDRGMGLPGFLTNMILIELGGGGFRTVVVPFLGMCASRNLVVHG
jgi:hypothetical protein